MSSSSVELKMGLSILPFWCPCAGSFAVVRWGISHQPSFQKQPPGWGQLSVSFMHYLRLSMDLLFTLSFPLASTICFIILCMMYNNSWNHKHIVNAILLGGEVASLNLNSIPWPALLQPKRWPVLGKDRSWIGPEPRITCGESLPTIPDLQARKNIAQITNKLCRCESWWHPVGPEHDQKQKGELIVTILDFIFVTEGQRSSLFWWCCVVAVLSWKEGPWTNEGLEDHHPYAATGLSVFFWSNPYKSTWNPPKLKDTSTSLAGIGAVDEHFQEDSFPWQIQP